MEKIDFKDLIVYEDGDYVLINKPPHFATLDERTADNLRSVLRLAKAYVADAQVCHRLDKETSGVLAIAKNPAAYRHLSMQFEHRQVVKSYHAVVGGIHDLDSISVYLPIAQLTNGTVKIDREKGKEAETIFNTRRAYRLHTLVDCHPITGRTHQIRIHLSCLKAPIVMDEQYGGKPIYLSQLKKNFNLKRDTEELPLIQRVALHAYALTFARTDGEEITVEAPYPKDFAALIRQLEKNS
ncbi:MAG: RNA pseudouridine synthase [Ferruginibacter sp.]|nr:RNA pseudouridine synthase [Cytophagales bacterium]